MFSQNRIFISRGIIGKRTCFTIDGRSLHEALGIKRDFSTWIRKRITDYQFVEGQDFQTDLSGNAKQKDGKGTDYRHPVYFFGLDMAKELCTLEKSEEGRLLRRYIIESEDRLTEKARASRPSTLSEERIKALSDAIQNHMRKAGKASRELGRKRREYFRRAMDIQGIHSSPLLELFDQLDRSNDMTFRVLDDLAESIARNMEVLRILTEDMT